MQRLVLNSGVSGGSLFRVKDMIRCSKRLMTTAFVTKSTDSFFRNIVDIVKAPVHQGQAFPGVETAPDRILEDAALVDSIKKISAHDGGRRWTEVNVLDNADASFANKLSDRTIYKGKGAVLRNAAEVGHACHTLSHATYTSAVAGSFVLTLGGDHSVSIGSIAGLQQHYRNLSVIWVDAHADLNTPDTTYSGNLHGCTAGFLLNIHKCNELAPMRWLKECQTAAILKPQNVVYIGLRDLDPAERDHAKSLGVLAFSILEVEKHGIAAIMNATLEHLEKNNPGAPFHLNFDIDGIDECAAPSTGYPSPTGFGLTAREGHYICNSLYETGRLVSMDMVEINPLIGSQADADKTLQLARSLILSALGHHYMQVPADYKPIG